MCSALIGFFYIFYYLNISSEIVNVMILKLLDIHLFIDFETILCIARKEIIFKIDLNANNCNCSLALLGLQGWVHLVKYQKVFLLRTRIYLFAPMVLDETNMCHYYLKSLCCCLNMILYPDNKVVQSLFTQIWER